MDGRTGAYNDGGQKIGARRGLDDRDSLASWRAVGVGGGCQREIQPQAIRAGRRGIVQGGAAGGRRPSDLPSTRNRPPDQSVEELSSGRKDRLVSDGGQM